MLKRHATRMTNPRTLLMRLGVCATLLFAAVLVLTASLFAQDNTQLERPQALSTVIPLKGAIPGAAMAGVSGAGTIPLFSYSITSPLDNHLYSGTMVGRSPFFHGARTTKVPTIVVPLKIVFSTGATFDPTATDNTCSPSGTPLSLVQASPILTPLSISMGGTAMGVTQYVDAFQRGNFWTNVSATGSHYHTTLNPVTTLATVTVNVPSADGTVFSDTVYSGCGGTIGVMNINWFDPLVTGTIIPSLAASGVGPTTFPIFLLKNVVMTSGTPSFPSNCCILGYHGAFGSPVQTYSPVDYDTSGIFTGVHDIGTMSHEVGEWMDDPLGNNPTPSWGHIGQVSGCQSNLETGDPLSGTQFPSLLAANSFTYHPQELAFFSWFFRQSPSLGVNNWFSDNDTFTQDAGAACH